MIHDRFEKVNGVRDLRMEKLVNSMSIELKGESTKTRKNLRGDN